MLADSLRLSLLAANADAGGDRGRIKYAAALINVNESRLSGGADADSFKRAPMTADVALGSVA